MGGDLDLGLGGGRKIITLKFCDPNFSNDPFKEKFQFFHPKLLMTFLVMISSFGTYFA